MDELSPAHRNRKILMAEDSAVQGVMLRRILIGNGFQTTWAKSGTQAVEELKKNIPDIIISDVEMPGMNGFELCSYIKNSDTLKNIPVILCTSLSGPEDLIKGIEAGADGYITKPYDESSLLVRIDTLLSNPIRMRGDSEAEPVQITYAGKPHSIVADRLHILNLLLSTYENTVKQNNELIQAQLELKKVNQNLDGSYKESERLLLNVLPKEIAEELKKKGSIEPVLYESATVLFTDMKGFTKISEGLSPLELLSSLDECFSFFDGIMESHGIEKLKTIGDSYMAVGGIPRSNSTHAIDCILAALEIQDYMDMMKMLKVQQNIPYWDLRLGINTGPVIAGVIGSKKFAFDIWGDSVNLASRMESAGVTGKVNISEHTFDLVKDFFDCEYRGKVSAKNKGEVDMYFVVGIKPELSVHGDGKSPNEKFRELYDKMKSKT